MEVFRVDARNEVVPLLVTITNWINYYQIVPKPIEYCAIVFESS